MEILNEFFGKAKLEKIVKFQTIAKGNSEYFQCTFIIFKYTDLLLFLVTNHSLDILGLP